MSGSILLGDVAARTETLEIACRACPRHEVARTDKLLAEHGRAMTMPTLLRLLAGDCPKLKATNFYDLRGVHSPTLRKVFAGARRRADRDKDG
jgi:hypothetical protein